MKKILITACLGLFGASLFANEIISVDNLKTKAKSVTRTDFSIVSKFGEYFRTPSVKYHYTFDSNGRIIESAELTPRDAVVNKIINTYDAVGNLSSQVCVDADNNQIWKNVTTYKNALKSDCSEYNKNGSLTGKTTYAYDEDNLVDESCYNSEGALVWKIIYEYDADDRVECEYEYFSDGTLYEKREYTYTNQGAIDTITYYDGKEALNAKDVYRYGADKVLNEVTTYDSENKIIKRSVMKNDTFGNCTRLTVYNVARKFGSTQNEMVEMYEYLYDYNIVDAK